jgi:iron(III) transport system substrate-binding protein
MRGLRRLRCYLALSLVCAGTGLAGADAWAAEPVVQDKLDQLARLTGPERQRFLEEQAIKEGKVVMYASDHPDLIRSWNAEFRKRYPQIDAQFIRMTTRDMMQRAVNESQAGRPVTDLLHPPAAELAILQRQGLIARYPSPEAADFEPDFRDPQGWWTVFWLSPEVVGFNTNLVKRADVPTTLEGRTAPALRGKIGRGPNGAAWVAGVRKIRGETEGMELMRRIAAVEPRVYESNTAMGNALASGQVAMAFDILVTVVGPLKAKGAPVDYVVPDPMFVLPVYQVIMKDAPHPFAAALAYDWILSKQGQAMYKGLNQLGPRKDTDYPYLDVMRSGGTILSLSPVLLADPAPHQKTFEDLFIRK